MNFKYIAAFLTGIAAIAGSVIILPFFRNYEIRVLDKTVIPYDDRIEKSLPGNSEVLWVHNDPTELKMSYILRDGFSYPYAGLLIPLTDSSGKYFDFSRYDALKIRIASSQLSDCKVYCMVFDTNLVSRADIPLNERYLQKNLVLDTVSKSFQIPFNQFTTPEWWFQKNNITLKDVAPVDFSRVTSLKIESGSTAKTGIVDTVTISGIYLTKRPKTYMLVTLLFSFIVCIIYAFFRSAPRKKNDPVVITYDKKEVRSYRDIDAQRISDYLAKHFSDSDISIITTGKAIGLSQKKIARIMNEEFKMSFKQYLTSIRIFEAKRLLLETDRLVIDIALAVGFNNISHFNRVFKTSTQTSPLEFRNSKTVNENGYSPNK